MGLIDRLFKKTKNDQVGETPKPADDLKPPESEPEIIKINVDEIDDQKTLFEIVKTHEDKSIRDEAFSKLTDEEMLIDLALNCDDEKMRLWSFNKIKDENLIFRIAKESEDKDIRMGALYDLTDENLLAELCENAQHEDVRNSSKALFEAEEKDIQELECSEFAKAFKMAIFRKNTSKAFDDIMPVWKEKCPSDGNLGFALSASLYFDKSEDTKTIFLNMNDIFHVASSRICADKELRTWFVHFAFEYIDKYRIEYRS